MSTETTLSKFESLRQSTPRVIFGYCYYRSKIEDYVSATNMRLEAVQVKDGKVLFTQAAPVLQVAHSRNLVQFVDKHLALITSGPRANILLKEQFLKTGEEFSPAPHTGTEEVTTDSNIETIERVVDLLTGKPFPGRDMRLPEFYRCTKNPARMRLNITQELLDQLGMKVTDGAEAIKEKFLQQIDIVAGRTEKGYILPFDWINAGGMLTADGRDMVRGYPKITHIRTPEFFKQYIETHKWEITCI